WNRLMGSPSMLVKTSSELCTRQVGSTAPLEDSKCLFQTFRVASVSWSMGMLRLLVLVLGSVIRSWLPALTLTWFTVTLLSDQLMSDHLRPASSDLLMPVSAARRHRACHMGLGSLSSRKVASSSTDQTSLPPPDTRGGLAVS